MSAVRCISSTIVISSITNTQHNPYHHVIIIQFGSIIGIVVDWSNHVGVSCAWAATWSCRHCARETVGLRWVSRMNCAMFLRIDSTQSRAFFVWFEEGNPSIENIRLYWTAISLTDKYSCIIFNAMTIWILYLHQSKTHMYCAIMWSHANVTSHI